MARGRQDRGWGQRHDQRRGIDLAAGPCAGHRIGLSHGNVGNRRTTKCLGGRGRPGRSIGAELTAVMSAVAESETASGVDLRRMALALVGTSEAPHFDRAAFKVMRIYVTLAADGRTANFKFSPDE